MKRLFICWILVSICFSAYSQSYFSVLPDFGGKDMEGRAFNIIPLESEIKIIGDIKGSLDPELEEGLWQVFCTLDYNGDIQNSVPLIDSSYDGSFVYFTRRIAFKNDSICYVYDRRYIGNEFLDAYLIELDYLKGVILRSKIIFDQTSENETFAATDLKIGRKGNIYLVNVTDEWGQHPQVLTVLDSNLQVQVQKIIPNYGRSNITKYIEEDPDGNLILVGVSLGQETPVWFESKLFYQVLDTNYESIDFRLSPTALDQSIVGYQSYPIIKAKTGEWVFASQVVKETSDCMGCSVLVPYVVRVSNDFTNVLSETRLFDRDINAGNNSYFVRSITEVNDGFIFAGSTIGVGGIETCGLLGKVSLDGDSLWLKRFFPLAWETDQANLIHWQDIKTTPAGNIVIGGYASDGISGKTLPWILHLDADGCIEPGCLTVATEQYIDQEIGFSIYPNPVKKYSSIHVSLDIQIASDFQLRVISNLGNIIYEVPIKANETEIIIEIKNIPSGNYLVQLTNGGNFQVTKKLSIVN